MKTFVFLVLRKEHAITLKAAAPDTAAKLMQLCQSEPLSVLDDDDGRVRNINADLYNRCRNQYIGAACRELIDASLHILSFHVPGDSLDANTGIFCEPGFEILCGRFDRLYARQSIGVGILNQRADNIALMPLLDLLIYGFHAGILVRPDNSLDGFTPGRHGMDVDDFSAFPVQRSCQRSRDRCSAHADIMNAFFCFLLKTLTLLYAESMLLVHNRKTQFFELDLIGKDRMCTYHNIRLTRSDFRKCCLLFPDFHAAVQEHGSVPELCEEIRKIIIMLSGQHQCRTHHCTLISVHSHT